ncbi:MAG: helicase [Oscillospiraceae bacterium]|nr:helicase [Oscillospiraceae bacterium]
MARKRKKYQKRKKAPLPEGMMRAQEITEELGLSEQALRAYLPEPAEYIAVGRGRQVACWRRADVERLLRTNPRARAAADTVLERRKRRAEARAYARQREAVFSYLSGEFGLDNLLRRAAFLDRRFVLHVGPTNSGKTYDAIEALRAAGSGAYLGPLRLLALEMFDKLNAQGCRCTLLTGEEKIEVDGASHVASTIELCSFRERYDVAVIDEAQMLADPSRGAHWTRALLGVDASEVHVCLAPEAREIICWLLDQIGAPYTVREHKRLCPLIFAGKFGGWDEVQPGDALITFSRRGVLGISAELEKRGVRASVIYGALPPESRREEVRKFARKETTVVVATDAIGMGISLPIRRIIFCETQKYDGVSRRPLNKVEIQQIAGRAGRYGIYSVGGVLTFSDEDLVRHALQGPAKQIHSLTTPFPTAALASEYPLDMLLHAWQELPPDEREQKADMSDALVLLRVLSRDAANFSSLDRGLVYDLITCPVDTQTRELVLYWADCVRAILRGRRVPQPRFDLETLEGCENQYKAYDIRCQLLRRVGIDESVTKEKRELAGRINAFLAQDKQFLQRKCPECGRLLSFDWPFRTCDKCHFRRR